MQNKKIFNEYFIQNLSKIAQYLTIKLMTECPEIQKKMDLHKNMLFFSSYNNEMLHTTY